MEFANRSIHAKHYICPTCKYLKSLPFLYCFSFRNICMGWNLYTGPISKRCIVVCMHKNWLFLLYCVMRYGTYRYCFKFTLFIYFCSAKRIKLLKTTVFKIKTVYVLLFQLFQSINLCRSFMHTIIINYSVWKMTPENLPIYNEN